MEHRYVPRSCQRHAEIEHRILSVLVQVKAMSVCRSKTRRFYDLFLTCPIMPVCLFSPNHIGKHILHAFSFVTYTSVGYAITVWAVQLLGGIITYNTRFTFKNFYLTLSLVPLIRVLRSMSSVINYQPPEPN